MAERMLETGLKIKSVGDEVFLSPVRMWDKLALINAVRTAPVPMSDESGHALRTKEGLPVLASSWAVDGITGYRSELGEDKQETLRVQAVDECQANAFVKWAADTLLGVYAQRAISEYRISPTRRRPEPKPKPEQ